MGVLSAVIDGLAYGSGDACIGINPAGDNLNSVMNLLGMLMKFGSGTPSPPRPAC